MDTDPFASRVATHLRLTIAAIGAASLVLAIANLFWHGIDDEFVALAATLMGTAAAGLSLCQVFDSRFHRAWTALNAKRQAEARKRGRLSRLTGWGLSIGDRLLLAVRLPLLAMSLVAFNYFHRGPATALLFAAFALLTVAQIALIVRQQPADR